MKTLFTFLMLVIMTSNINAQNDSLGNDYLRSPFQLTLFTPPFSTNGAANVDYINDLSLNLFVGVSGGVEVMEIGGFINIDRMNVNGVQLAGFGNTVGGSLHGVQLAGFYNVNGGNTDVIQLAGFSNVSGGYMSGLQGAGFMNVTGGPLTGMQAAGFMNITGNDVLGLQAAGFMNMAGQRTVGFQGAGFMNISGENTAGFQGAGFANVAGGMDYGFQGAGFGNFCGNGSVNFQGAGFMNVAGSVKGIQAAGFMNIAGYVKGVQAAGFINICDSIDGVPIGFINIVKKNGYHKIELAGSELMYASASWKMGVQKLYNIYTIGKPFGPANSFLLGWGFGSELELSPTTRMNVEAVSLQELIIDIPDYSWWLRMSNLNMYNQLRVNFGWQMTSGIGLFAGPTFNVAVQGTSNTTENTAPTDFSPSWTFYNRIYSDFHNTTVKMWFGINAGIRFL